MPRIPSWRAAWLFFPLLALALTGCFQAAGDSVQPTPVSLTAIATLQMDAPTPFVTPLPAEGFVPPTDDPNSFLTATPFSAPEIAAPTQGIDVFPPTVAPDLPTADLAAPALATSGLSAPVSVPTSTLPPTPTALVQNTPCQHTVQPGEWFYSIARKYNVNPEELVAANPRQNPDSLQVGDILRIPNCNQQPTVAGPPPTETPQSLLPAPTSFGTSTPIPTPVQLSGRTYTVSQGDTLGSIARKFDTTVQALKEANGLTSDLLHVGDVLKIPKP